MKITLKNLKINLAFSEETTQFMADVYADGVKIASARNDGQGGCTNYYAEQDKRPLLTAAETYCASLPKVKVTETFSYSQSLENVIDELVEAEVAKKETAKFAKKLQKDMLKGIVYGTPNSYTITTWVGHTIASLMATSQGRGVLQAKILELKIKKETILNTNLKKYQHEF